MNALPYLGRAFILPPKRQRIIIMLKDKIAEHLELAFSEFGFAEPSVTQLKDACGVSLRTLYKYFPSKEAMVVGALEFRHQRYLNFLTKELPQSDPSTTIQHIFKQLKLWMLHYAPHGCMSMNAIAAFPDNKIINQTVLAHKELVCQFLGELSFRQDIAKELFILHEGVSSSWPILGDDAVAAAEKVAIKLLEGENNE